MCRLPGVDVTSKELRCVVCFQQIKTLANISLFVLFYCQFALSLQMHLKGEIQWQEEKVFVKL